MEPKPLENMLNSTNFQPKLSKSSVSPPITENDIHLEKIRVSIDESITKQTIIETTNGSSLPKKEVPDYKICWFFNRPEFLKEREDYNLWLFSPDSK